MNETVAARVEALDWAVLERQCDEDGFSVLPAILTPGECGELVGLYGDEARFRTRIDMARHRFGEGEYQYLAYPLPAVVQTLRETLYARLAPLANRWAESLRQDERFPDELGAFLEVCHAQGQPRPTPLILRYEAGGYNCLHQDVYGAVGFPLQAVFMLSREGVDYTGGELLLVEQRPRAQSRGDVVKLNQGGGLLFANRYRPVQGGRGVYRATVRHGVSRVHSGSRATLGIIFHDAA